MMNLGSSKRKAPREAGSDNAESNIVESRVPLVEHIEYTVGKRHCYVRCVRLSFKFKKNDFIVLKTQSRTHMLAINTRHRRSAMPPTSSSS